MKYREKSMVGKRLPILLEIPTTSFGSSALFDEREKLRVEYRWISNRRALLAKKYADMYIAVKNKQVLLAEKSVCALLVKLRASGIDPNSVAVEFVSE
jgi:hypothetical protein